MPSNQKPFIWPAKPSYDAPQRVGEGPWRKTFAGRKPGYDALLVVGNAPTLSACDTVVYNALVRNGFKVTVVDDGAAADFLHDLVVIAESCATATVGTKYSTFPGGLLELNSGSNEDLTSQATSNTGAQSTVAVADTQSPIAANQSGTISVVSSTELVQMLAYTSLADTARVLFDNVATAGTDTTGIAYEKGATLLNGHVAEGRRVWLGFFQDSNSDYTAVALSILDAAIAWTASVPQYTRFWSSMGLPAGSAPAADALWDDDFATAVYGRRQQLQHRKPAENPYGSSNYTKNGSLNVNADTLLGQMISAPLDRDQRIEGVLRATLFLQETNLTDDYRAQMVVWVQANDGTRRGTLYAGDTGALAREAPQASLVATEFPQFGGWVYLTAVDALAGDRIVIEFGARQHSATGANITGSSGDSTDPDAKAGDAPASTAGWVDISGAYTFIEDLLLPAAYLDEVPQPIPQPAPIFPADLEPPIQPPAAGFDPSPYAGLFDPVDGGTTYPASAPPSYDDQAVRLPDEIVTVYIGSLLETPDGGRVYDGLLIIPDPVWWPENLPFNLDQTASAAIQNPEHPLPPPPQALAPDMDDGIQPPVVAFDPTPYAFNFGAPDGGWPVNLASNLGPDTAWWPEAIPAEVPLWAAAAQLAEPTGGWPVNLASNLGPDTLWWPETTPGAVFDPTPYVANFETPEGGWPVNQRGALGPDVVWWPEIPPAEVPLWTAAAQPPEPTGGWRVNVASNLGPDVVWWPEAVPPAAFDPSQGLAASLDPAQPMRPVVPNLDLSEIWRFDAFVPILPVSTLPSILIDVATGDVYAYIGSNFIAPLSPPSG